MGQSVSQGRKSDFKLSLIFRMDIYEIAAVCIVLLICTFILFEPRLRNFKFFRDASAAIGMDSRKLFDNSNSTRLDTPKNITFG